MRRNEAISCCLKFLDLEVNNGMIMLDVSTAHPHGDFRSVLEDYYCSKDMIPG